MPLLKATQANFIDTINQGPAALDRALFDGPNDRIHLGLKAHANTISHARLVALEDCFPLTRDALGDGIFNTLSRQYCETPVARASDANTIGAEFVYFLEQHQRNDGVHIAEDIADLAKIEWAWLESYHSADAVPLALADLAMLDENSLLTLTLTAHPAARIVALTAPSFILIPELGDTTEAKAVLIVRPDTEVHVLALNALNTVIFNAAQKGAQICNLLEMATEEGDDAETLDPIITLIGAGALVLSELSCKILSPGMTS